MILWHWHCGPLGVLIVGRVWSIDWGKRGIYGDGWRIGFRKVRP